ncbi:hypothetical protein M3580_03525 [Bacillus safensis]|nr:hypothetical protein [Bacillus safensis]MCM2988298.1 hypothetical protein [Bacillus safensis]
MKPTCLDHALKTEYEKSEAVNSQLLQIKAQEEASEVFIDSVKVAAVGLYDVAKDTVVGTYDLVTDPGGAVEAVVTAVSHPLETSKAIFQTHSKKKL